MLRLFGEWGGGSVATGVLVLVVAVAGYLASRRWLRRDFYRRNQERERMRRDFWGWG